MKQTNKVMSAILFLILLVGFCGTVSAVNVYQTIAPFKSETGHLYVTVLCHHNLFSKEMVLVKEGFAPDVNVTLKLHPDGTYDGMFIGGNYTLTLLDGNAGHPETTKFTIRNGFNQYVTFIGHAVTFDHSCPLGQERVNGVCVPKECNTGMMLNQTSGDCEPIVCPVGTQLVGNTCEPIECPLGEELVEGQCTPIVCDTGMFFNQTSGVCEPIVCPVGTQLVGNNCEPIVCPVGTHLVGNDCVNDCVPALNIVSAFYGFLGMNCYNNTIIDVPAHTEYRYWISGTPAHTEYRFSDFVNDTFKEVCHPEVNHTEYQISTYKMISDITYNGHYRKSGNSSEYHYDSNGGDYDFTKVGWFNGDSIVFGLKENGYYKHFKYLDVGLGNWQKSNPGHTDAVYGWVVTTEFTDGTCPSTIARSQNVGDTKCEQRTVVTEEAYCETVIDVPGYQGEFSDWCNDQPEAKDGRIIETRNVPDDMVNGHYSNWSDTPEGSCVKRSDFSIACENEPCQTREVPAVTHEETVCENVGGMADVTQNVKDVVASGHASFVFDNRPSPGGIFDIVGGTLLSQIADPAPGYVKTVTITFNMGCDSQDETVTAGEYEVIDLAPRV